MNKKSTIKYDIEQAARDFTEKNPEVAEALEVFDIAAAEYERAIRALHPSVTYTGSSSQPAQFKSHGARVAVAQIGSVPRQGCRHLGALVWGASCKWLIYWTLAYGT